ncbi:MAG: class I SAM-dependent methyltransferase [Novosphingobium sp.]
MAEADIIEDFKPVPVDPGSGSFALFKFRLRSWADLQLLTCIRFITAHRHLLTGKLLDVGCGQMPFRHLLPPGTNYTGIDIPDAGRFGMGKHADIVEFDGTTIPFPDNHFDTVMCTEVLEHAVQPEALIAEMHRVLRPGGSLVLTVPFAARVHHVPYDFHRFTRYRLAQMFAAFGAVQIEERGNDLAVIANKIIVATIRQLRPLRSPLLLIGVPASLASLAIAHLALWLGWGSKLDPLGYGLIARKD